jgi:hypothetical protein
VITAPARPASSTQYITYKNGYHVQLQWSHTTFSRLNVCPVDTVTMTCTNTVSGKRLLKQTSNQLLLTSAQLDIDDLAPLTHYQCSGVISYLNYSFELQSKSLTTPGNVS